MNSVRQPEFQVTIGIKVEMPLDAQVWSSGEGLGREIWYGYNGKIIEAG